MRASKPSLSAVIRTAHLSRVRSCTASYHWVKWRSDDGIIHARCAPLARQELQLYLTQRVDGR